MLEFKERFVCFLDILGFSEIVKDHSEVQRVMAIIDGVVAEAVPTDGQKIYPTDPVRKTVFSDSIVLSILLPEDQYETIKTFRFLLHVVEQIQLKCALGNVWMRGGISWGPLHHDVDGGNVIGHGLVKAYAVEQVATYPRVVIDPAIIPGVFRKRYGARDKKSLIKDINITFNAPAYSGTFLYDSEKCPGNGFQGFFQDDVPLFVNYMGTIYGDKVTEAARDKLGENIRMRLYAKHDPKIYAKYRWVIDYLKATTSVGLYLDKGLPGYISSL